MIERLKKWWFKIRHREKIIVITFKKGLTRTGVKGVEILDTCRHYLTPYGEWSMNILDASLFDSAAEAAREVARDFGTDSSIFFRSFATRVDGGWMPYMPHGRLAVGSSFFGLGSMGIVPVSLIDSKDTSWSEEPSSD